ncbi:MAG: acyl-CoA dehydrogenase family protein [Proteobacteria bacterium]|nr:acyl-CoA dehydrogenase family protein [Pseudomonadota bacterium]
MDFTLTESQSLLRDAATRLVADHGDAPDIWQRMAALGLLGIGIDEAHGGTGGGFHDHAVVLEALGGGLVRSVYIPTVVVGAHLISTAGTDAQQAVLLPKIVAGEMTVAVANAESASFEPCERIGTQADRIAGGYRLSGVKPVVMGADTADVIIVSARTGGGPGGREGLSLFLVATDTAGMVRHGYPIVDGNGAADIAMDGVALGAETLLGTEGEAASLIDLATDRTAAALCCDAVGAMAALNALTLEHLKTRVQFGRPIGKFQILQHRMVDMTIAEEMARSMAVYGADEADGDERVARGKAVSAAKSKIGDCARTVGQGSIQLHGGIGMTDDYAAGDYFKRLTAFEMLAGNSEDHLERYAFLGTA